MSQYVTGSVRTVLLAISVLCGILCLALASLGISALVLGPVISVVGVGIFLVIFNDRVWSPELSGPSNYKLSAAGQAELSSTILDSWVQLVECSSFQQAIIDQDFVCRALSPVAAEQLPIEFGQHLRASENKLSGLLLELEHIREAFFSNGKVPTKSQAVLKLKEASIKTDIIPLVDNNFGELYFLLNFTDKNQVSSVTLKQEEVKKFLSGLAHDLNNLFTGLENSLGMLKKQTHSSLTEKQVKLLSNLGRIAASGSKLTRNLLDYSKGIDGKRSCEAVDLSRVIEEVVSLVESDSRFAKVRISGSATPGLWVWGSSNGLHQVLLNLFYNSLDAMEAGGELDLHIREVGDSIELNVSDNGCGMTPEVQAVIFEPFFTTKKTAAGARYLGGSGLGLTNVKLLVESWGGQITCRSVLDVGTTFTISFYRAPKPAYVSGSASL